LPEAHKKILGMMERERERKRKGQRERERERERERRGERERGHLVIGVRPEVGVGRDEARERDLLACGLRCRVQGVGSGLRV